MHPEAAVLQFFRTFEADLASGSVRQMEDYARAIPEHADRIRDEYLRLTGDGPEPGARILGGRYRLLESLGRGSFGEVFLAQDSKMRRRVAIKVLDEFRALSAEWRERLIREAEATHRIGDDGSCTVYDVGFEGNVPFLVMPWIQGQSLDRIFSTSAALGRSPVWVRDGLAPSEVLPAFLGLIEKVARTLHAAHEGGVIHRDIKPANILVRPDGRPVLIDFGLAWLDETEARATRSATFGTPAYSAPEVRAGELERPDPRVDVWSLGVVLYEGLVGERPFSVAAGRRPANSAPARLDRRFGRDVQAVIEAALAPAPAHRYQDMAAFADDLDRLRRGEGVSVRPAGRFRRAAAWVRRRPAAVGLGALAFAVVTALVTAYTQSREQAVVDEAVVALAETVDELAEGLTRRGKFGMTVENRIEDAEETLLIARRLRNRFGSTPQIDNSLSRILVVLAEAEILVGHMEEAELKLREAVGLLDRLASSGQRSSRQDLERRSHALILIGDTMTRAGKIADARETFTAALAIDEQLWREFPDDAKCASDVGFGYLRMGSCEQAFGRTTRSLELVEQALGALLRAEQLEPGNAARSLHVAEAQRTLARWSLAADAENAASAAGYLSRVLDRQEAWTAIYPADGNGWRQLILTAVLGLSVGLPEPMRARCELVAERCVREIRVLASVVPIDLGAASVAQVRRAGFGVGSRSDDDTRRLVADGEELARRALDLASDEEPVQHFYQGFLCGAADVYERLGEAERADELRRDVIEMGREQLRKASNPEVALLYHVKLLLGFEIEDAREEARRLLAEHRARKGEFSEELAKLEAELLAEDR
ncbi:MAG: serine/threonine-protein kinase [Planctomycetota bacterium]|nr:serine/threonine-protein kinase [Planctomycetota bacterium]